ncbi:hypothetical protein [Paraburkholderia silvatlantica]|uniref:hypothetical protein n=1 Tax=Paraburkholderia silvatlantica TaxID=321895 RepID=UPI003751F83A
MTRATVYRYKWYDVSTDSNKVRPMRGTREAIDRISGDIIEESAEEVDASLLDGNGFIRDDAAK